MVDFQGRTSASLLRAAVMLSAMWLGMSGCRTILATPYPTEWPARNLEVNSACDVSGEYWNVGELKAVAAPPGREQHAQLASLLLKGEAGPPMSARDDRSVRLWMRDNALTLQIRSGDRSSDEEIQLLPAAGSCTDQGYVSLRFEATVQSEPSLTHRITSLSVSSAQDRSLIIRLDFDFTSKSFPPTPHREETMWCRFERT